jgi:branched-chain amino acid transport system substrate-binding protein
MQEQKRNIVIFTYIAIFSIIIPAIFWFIGRSQAPKPVVSSPERSIAPPTKDSNQPVSRSANLDGRISIGEKLLIPADGNSNKQAAVRAFGVGDYQEAVARYNASLKVLHNDPEAWIYRNNALALATNNFLKIAVSVPIGGNLNVAKEILRGVAQMQEEINTNGGINGNFLLVEIANDDNDPAIVRQIATKLGRDKQVLGVIGHNSTEASVAAAPIYEESQLVAISPTTVGSDLSGIGDYIFRTTPDTRSTADILARYAVQSVRKTKVAICFASDAKASRSFKEAFEWSIFQAGGKAIEFNCDLSQPDFDPADVPAKAIATGADALLLAPSVYNINQAISLVQANKQRLPLLGNQTMYVFETLEQGASDANGMILSVAWHSTAGANSFTENARSMWGGNVGWRTAMAYDATKAMVTGLELGSTRRELQATLADADFTFTGATGTVQFLPSGDRNLKGVLVKINSGDRSGVGYDFIPVKP